MRQAISRSSIERIKPGTKPFDVRCTKFKGLIVRVQPSGLKSFYCEFGRNKRIKIGCVDHIAVSDAQQKVREIMQLVHEGKDPRKPLDGLSTLYVLEAFLDQVYAPWANEHLKSGRAIVKRLRRVFEDLNQHELSQITIFEIEKIRTFRLASGVKETTINRDVAALRALLSKAVDWGYIVENPLSNLKRLKCEDIPPTRFLHNDERDSLMSALRKRHQRKVEERCRYNAWRTERNLSGAKDLSSIAFVDYLEPMILLSLHTGLRRGELMNLKWECVFLEVQSPYLQVEASFSKSGKSRFIPLNQIAYQTLLKWREIAHDQRKEFVFVNSSGKTFTDVRSSWSRLLDDAGIKNFRWHDMRHDFASQLAMRGVDLNTIRVLLGHSDYKMTLRYAHLSPNIGIAAVSNLESL